MLILEFNSKIACIFLPIMYKIVPYTRTMFHIHLCAICSYLSSPLHCLVSIHTLISLEHSPSSLLLNTLCGSGCLFFPSRFTELSGILQAVEIGQFQLCNSPKYMSLCTNKRSLRFLYFLVSQHSILVSMSNFWFLPNLSFT